jgi:hypothetical protein
MCRWSCASSLPVLVSAGDHVLLHYLCQNFLFIIRNCFYAMSCLLSMSISKLEGLQKQRVVLWSWATSEIILEHCRQILNPDCMQSWGSFQSHRTQLGSKTICWASQLLNEIMNFFWAVRMNSVVWDPLYWWIRSMVSFHSMVLLLCVS